MSPDFPAPHWPPQTPGPPVPPPLRPSPLSLPAREHDPFRVLFEQRTVFLRGALREGAADHVVGELLALDADSSRPIRLIIDSSGGDPFGMFAIHDVVTGMRAPVDTVCLGLAASAAAFLLATGTGMRRAGPNARIMLGQPVLGDEGVRGHATADDVDRLAREFAALRERMEAILAERTGKSVEQVHADLDRDLWLSADDARAYGLVDQVGLH